MKGLEIIERPLSQLKNEHLFFRFDAEFCQKRFLDNVARIRRWPNGWTRLGDQLLELTGGATPFGANYPDNGIRFLRVQNVMPDYIDDGDLVFITPEDDEDLSRSRLQVDDVILTITGVSYGKASVVTPEFASAHINQHSVRMKLRSGALRPFFLSAFLNAAPGKLQSDQNITGVTRPALDYETLKGFTVPLCSDAFQFAIERAVRAGLARLAAARDALCLAEQTLLRALGLENWQPPEPLTYTRPATDVLAAGRFDSEHFQPRFDDLVSRIASLGEATTLGEALSFCERGTQPAYSEAGLPVVNSRHVRNGSVILDDENRVATIEDNELVIRTGDILMNGTGVGTIGRVAPYLHSKSALPDNHVTILRIKESVGLDPIFLSVQLAGLVGQEQVKKFLKGSSGQIELYPQEIRQFTVWRAPSKVQKLVRESVQSAHAARREAQALLAKARRAVEIAIEDSEPAALALLRGDPV